MFFAGLTQNKIAAKRANIFNHAKFQLGLVAGCSEKYIRTNIIVPAAPAIPKVWYQIFAVFWSCLICIFGLYSQRL